MEKKSIYRTVITIVVLSEEPISKDKNLEQIIWECSEEGSFLLGECNKKETELIGKIAVREIYKSGNSPEFFQMNDNGCSIEEEIEREDIKDYLEIES